MTMEKNLLAVVKRDRSSGSEKSQAIMPDPASNWRIRPAVTMGPIPSSIREPLCEAKITRR